jgi:hypothetical protein
MQQIAGNRRIDQFLLRQRARSSGLVQGALEGTTLRLEPSQSCRHSRMRRYDIRKRRRSATIKLARPGPTRRHSLQATGSRLGSSTAPVPARAGVMAAAAEAVLETMIGDAQVAAVKGVSERLPFNYPTSGSSVLVRQPRATRLTAMHGAIS